MFNGIMITTGYIFMDFNIKSLTLMSTTSPFYWHCRTESDLDEILFILKLNYETTLIF